jgi:hypothetical protein
MGIGMQMTYLGLPGAAPLEAESGLQLLRLLRHGIYFSDCRLTIEHLSQPSGKSSYEVRLDIATLEHGLRRIGRCAHDSAEAAGRCTFNMAIRVLRILSRRGRL